MELPMRAHRALNAWYGRMQALPSFEQAILSYETAELRRTWRRQAFRRWLTGTYAGAARWRNPRLLANA
jgi:hypothetical protein